MMFNFNDTLLFTYNIQHGENIMYPFILNAVSSYLIEEKN